MDDARPVPGQLALSMRRDPDDLTPELAAILDPWAEVFTESADLGAVAGECAAIDYVDPTWRGRRATVEAAVFDAQRAIDAADPDPAVRRHLQRALDALDGRLS